METKAKSRVLKCAFGIIFRNAYCLSFVFSIKSFVMVFIGMLYNCINTRVICEGELRVSNEKMKNYVFALGPLGGRCGRAPKQCSRGLLGAENVLLFKPCGARSCQSCSVGAWGSTLGSIGGPEATSRYIGG